MFKLYADEGTRRMIDISQSEQDIIDTMGDYLKGNPDGRFLIIESKQDGDDLRGFIRGYDEYISYVKRYNDTIKQKSCVELKSEIVKDVKVKRLKK